MLLTSDIIRIAASGGGLRLDCSKYLVSDIIRIAAAAKNGHAILILENYDKVLVSDRIRIASAGGGCVLFNNII